MAPPLPGPPSCKHEPFFVRLKHDGKCSILEAQASTSVNGRRRSPRFGEGDGGPSSQRALPTRGGCGVSVDGVIAGSTQSHAKRRVMQPPALPEVMQSHRCRGGERGQRNTSALHPQNATEKRKPSHFHRCVQNQRVGRLVES